MTLRKGCLSFLLVFGVIISVFAQNPFDIKAPGKKEEKKVINENNNSAPKSGDKKVETATNSAPTNESKPATQNQKTVIYNTPANQPTTNANSGKTSGNVFDIKPGSTNASVIINKSPEVNRPAEAPIVSPPQTNSTATKIENNSVQSQTSGPAGLEGVNNPFNIKPGNDPKVSTSASNENNGQIAIPTPEIADIKKQIDEFKTNTITSHGTISKNMWFIIYIFLILLAGIAINFNRSYPVALIKATYNQNQMRLLFKDAFKGNHTFIFGILYFIFIVNAGIFLYLAFHIFSLGSLSLFTAILIVFVTYLIRHLVLFVMGIIFPMTKETSLFSYTVGIYNLTIGLALMFLNIALSFVDPETGKMLIFSGLSIIGALYVMRQLRGLLSNAPAIVSAKFHFIIYLCTVEIAPWLLLSGILLDK